MVKERRNLPPDRVAPYQVEWDSGQDGVGTHRLHAEAIDLAGNIVISKSVSVVGGTP